MLKDIMFFQTFTCCACPDNPNVFLHSAACKAFCTLLNFILLLISSHPISSLVLSTANNPWNVSLSPKHIVNTACATVTRIFLWPSGPSSLHQLGWGLCSKRGPKEQTPWAIWFLISATYNFHNSHGLNYADGITVDIIGLECSSHQRSCH